MQTETTKTAEDYWIERRPLTHYLISVRSYTSGDGDHRDRRVCTQAVSLPIEGYESGDFLTGNEKIIDCVPATPGSVEAFVHYFDSGYWREESIGIEVPGADIPDWDILAADVVGTARRNDDQ